MLKYICVIGILIIILSGCNSNRSSEALTHLDLQYIEQQSSITEEVFVSSFTGLAYKDFKQGVKVYACNQLACTHQRGSGCSAFPNEQKDEGIFLFPFIYSNRLFYFEMRVDEILLMKSKLDGSDREVHARQAISSIEGSKVLRVGDKVYYWGNIRESEVGEDGYIDTISVNCEIYEADLKSGEIRQLSNFGTYYNYNIDDLIYCEGKLYFRYLVQQKSWKDTPYSNPATRLEALQSLSTPEFLQLIDMKTVVGSVGIEKKEQEVFDVDFYDCLAGVSDSRIFIQRNNELISYNHDWKDEKTEFILNETSQEAGFKVDIIGNDILLVSWTEYEKPSKYLLWVEEEKQFKDLGYTLEYNLLVEDFAADKILFAQTPLKASTIREEWNFILADKVKFFQGELSYTEIEVNLYD